jgi:hypothetical protein
MKLTGFEIRRIGNMFRNQDPSFARAKVTIGLRDEDSEVVTVIDLDVPTSYQGTNTIDTVRTKLLAESLRTLKAAVSLLDGKNIQSLYELVDADEKDRQALADKRWEAQNPPVEETGNG